MYVLVPVIGAAVGFAFIVSLSPFTVEFLRMCH